MMKDMQMVPSANLIVRNEIAIGPEQAFVCSGCAAKRKGRRLPFGPMRAYIRPIHVLNGTLQ
jgi:hypothetical protein